MKATINGHRMHYADAGPKSALPVILIHGFPFSHAMWRPQIEALQERYRVIAYDVRGHGKSEAGDGLYTIETFTDDLFGLMDHLGLTRAAWCGLSMGGYIALRAAERAPERLSALILADTKSEADTDAAKLKRAAAMKMLRQSGTEIFAAEFLKTAVAANTLSGKPELIGKIRRMILANSTLGIGGTLLALAARTDTTASLDRIAVPTLLLGGALDALTPPATLRSMRERIRGSEMHEIHRAGHLSNLENPADFNRQLLDFLDRIVSS